MVTCTLLNWHYHDTPPLDLDVIFGQSLQETEACYQHILTGTLKLFLCFKANCFHCLLSHLFSGLSYNSYLGSAICIQQNIVQNIRQDTCNM